MDTNRLLTASHQLKKKYTRLPLDEPNPAFKNETGIWTPILTIRVGSNHKQTPRFPAIVDSGSPCCLFKADIADYLGISLTNGIEAKIGGISQGMSEPVYFHRIKIYIEIDWVIDVTAGFIKKLSVAGILGRNGFFDNFVVNFDHSSLPPVLEITKASKIQ